MRHIAFVFPGQGSQYVGMGRSFYEHSYAARQIFQMADIILKYKLSRICFNGPEVKLSKTLYTQLATLATSVAAFMAFDEKCQQEGYQIQPEAVAGHSLGEYSALVVAKSLEFIQALCIVQRRAELMTHVAKDRPGGMLAILGLTHWEVDDICRQYHSNDGEYLQIANLNSPEQIVISGTENALNVAMQEVKKAGGKGIRLNVAGPFHCELMKEVEESFAEALQTLNISIPQIPIISNVWAEPVISPQNIKGALTLQLSHQVKWEASIRYMFNMGISTFIEIGPGKVLSGLIKKTLPDVTVMNIGEISDLERVLNELSNYERRKKNCNYNQ